MKKKRLDNARREAAERRRKQQEEEDLRNRSEGGFGGPEMAGMAGLVEELLKDNPEAAQLAKDPQVQKKLMEFWTSGGQKHSTDPDVQKILFLIQQKTSGARAKAGGAQTHAHDHSHAHGEHCDHDHGHPHPDPTGHGGDDDLD